MGFFSKLLGIDKGVELIKTFVYGNKKCSREMDNAYKELEFNNITTSHPL